MEQTEEKDAKFYLIVMDELYTWAYEHPEAGKRDWADGWNKYGWMRADCPLCEHLYQDLAGKDGTYIVTDCNQCLIFWGLDSDGTNSCLYGEDSLYHKWRNSRGQYDKRREYSLAIAQLARDKLKELTNEG